MFCLILGFLFKIMRLIEFVLKTEPKKTNYPSRELREHSQDYPISKYLEASTKSLLCQYLHFPLQDKYWYSMLILLIVFWVNILNFSYIILILLIVIFTFLNLIYTIESKLLITSHGHTHKHISTYKI